MCCCHCTRTTQTLSDKIASLPKLHLLANFTYSRSYTLRCTYALHATKFAITSSGTDEKTGTMNAKFQRLRKYLRSSNNFQFIHQISCGVILLLLMRIFRPFLSANILNIIPYNRPVPLYEVTPPPHFCPV